MCLCKVHVCVWSLRAILVSANVGHWHQLLAIVQCHLYRCMYLLSQHNIKLFVWMVILSLNCILS